MKLPICWALWIVGTVLIILCWIDEVSIPVGWAGFGIALIGTVWARLPQRQSHEPLEEGSDHEGE